MAKKTNIFHIVSAIIKLIYIAVVITLDILIIPDLFNGVIEDATFWAIILGTNNLFILLEAVSIAMEKE